MLVTGSPYASLFARIGVPSHQEARDAAAQHKPQSTPSPAAAKAEAGYDEPGFRMISPISHGSLAAAYQVIRSREAAAVPAPTGAPAAERAILSGLGIPSALNAYGEVLDSD